MHDNGQLRAAGHVTGEAILCSIRLVSEDDAHSVGVNFTGRGVGSVSSSGSPVAERQKRTPSPSPLKRDRVNPRTYEYAKEHRAEQTPAEQKLWAAVRKRNGQHPLGVKVRRQVVMYGYIVDFWIPAWRVVVELDDDSHIGREEWDRRRDAAITSLNITVLRFKNSDVFRDIEGVIERIQECAPIIRPPSLASEGETK